MRHAFFSVMKLPRSNLTILSRLVLGYLAIFLLVAGMSVYALVQISRLNELTQSVLTINNRTNDYAEKLTDAILSQVQYEKKFIISKDEAFYRQFLQQKIDFDRYLGEMRSTADSPEMRDFLNHIEGTYQQYQSLVDEETGYLRAKKNYSEQRFRKEKERATDTIIEELETLKAQIQKDTTDKIEKLGEMGIRWRTSAILLTGAFLIFGILLSFWTSRSITKPLSLLGKKTQEIAGGDLKGDLNVISPPELAELAKAFNVMCGKLSELDQLKKDFFSSITHELRTPLTTIKLGLGLLYGGIEGPVTEEQKKLLGTLDGECNRLSNLVNTILDLAKMEAGMMTYHFEKQPLDFLIHRVTAELRPLAESKKIGLEARVIDGLPFVRVDSERILQVLRNIVGNAIKFTPDGGQVRLSLRPVDQGVEVSVADTGPPIPPEELTTIFEKFQQAPSRRSHEKKGTGLGLAIARQIVTDHGGRIWAESKTGTGNTFIFVLPV